jgi:EAL domain-containing protein (putative c-di-GMP-specific phosphodiesterase class I)/GGDEF domain-containing protein
MGAEPLSGPRLGLVGGGASTSVAEPGALLAAGLDIAYQPIVHLGSGQVIAYEALARPRHPAASSPLSFFSTLEHAGLRIDGERAAFEAAMAGWCPSRVRQKLFVNASPLTLVDPDFDVLELLDLAEAHVLAPSDLVIEVTESEAVDDIDALTLRVRRLRRLGIGVAVDDAGAGHASFRVITRLRPSYIKLDRDLVSGVDSDGARHAFLDAMVRFARQIGSRLVAEGIETEGELASLAGLGVEAGQGYFLARPAVASFTRPSDEARRLIAGAAQRLHLGAAQVTVGELARPVVLLNSTATVEEAYTRFAANPSVGVYLLEGKGGAQAQLSRRGLERLLAAPGAWERLAQRPVREVAEHEPLRVVAQLDVAEVGDILAARHAQDVVDDIVVTDPRGTVVGIVDVRDILRTLAAVRQQRGDELNALTGLPGTSWVETEAARRLDRGDTTTVVLCDVDGFRDLNHLGGFSLGDEVIRVLGRCLAGVCAGIAEAGLAHAGGDQFVILVPPGRFEELIAQLVRSIESEVMPLVRTELRIRGAEDTFERLGVSLAGTDLTGEPPPGVRYLEWARGRLARPLRTAKSHPGYASVHQNGRRSTVTTWSPRSRGQRTVALGLAEPCVVLRALDVVERSWEDWWAAHQGEDPNTGATRTLERFPGPPAVVERLLERYAVPLRARAQAALRARHAVMEVTLEGEEAELLEVLDRLALVTRQAHEPGRLPILPEVALIERLLRQRARAIVRRDTMIAAAPDA